MYAEYFQITFFLITERLKGKDSFWKPFFDSLPQSNETLFTVPPDTPIKPGSSTTLLSEIDRTNDDILTKIKIDLEENGQCKTRFKEFLEKYLVHINAKTGHTYTVDDYMDHYWWAWMNLCTRCFGYYHTPNDIAMCPLMDMVNHKPSDVNTRFILMPIDVASKMLEIQIDKMTQKEDEESKYEQRFGWR